MPLYLRFSLLFFVGHLVCYYLAGFIEYQISKKMYAGKNRLYRAFFRDTEDKREVLRINALLLPTQLLRALLMSVVLYPVLGTLMGFPFWLKFAFMGGLMFVYTDFASAIPFSNTIEGLVYLKREFVRPKVFWTIQFEAVLYSSLFGFFSALFLL